MATDSERATAITALEGLNGTRRQLLRGLRAEAKAAILAGDAERGRALTLAANQVSRARTRIAQARAHILLAQSLVGPIADLRRLTAEAHQTLEAIESAADALTTATRLIDIFRIVVLFN
jgi:hypothetical protein